MLRAKRKRVDVEKIKIPADFIKSPPKSEKLILKTADYINKGELSPVYIDKDYNLIDGYCSYLIYRTLYHEKITCIVVREE